jgi:hypothetical protein
MSDQVIIDDKMRLSGLQTHPDEDTNNQLQGKRIFDNSRANSPV